MMMWDVSGVIAMDKKNCHELWQFFCWMSISLELEHFFIFHLCHFSMFGKCIQIVFC